MRALNEREEQAFRDAVTNGPYDKAAFDRATRVLRWEKALTPDGVVYETNDWPTRVYDWRRRKDWALDLLERHQAAARAAHAEFWRVFMSSNG